jgi:hypothetical protein
MNPTADNAVEDIGECNMGDPATLEEFIHWGMTNYPANYNAVILWNHGGGWREQQEALMKSLKMAKTNKEKEQIRRALKKKRKPNHKAICWDDTNGDVLYMKEVREAFNAAENEVDLIGFDACLMGMIEVAHELKGTGASVMVGSEEVEPWDGWPYDTILAELRTYFASTPDEFGSAIVDLYYQSYGNQYTQAAIDLARIDILSSKVSEFAEIIRNSWDSDRVAVQTAAEVVMDELDATVIHEQHGPQLPGSYGLAIYYPVTGVDPDYNGTVIEFPNETEWEEFLYDFNTVMRGSWIEDARYSTQSYYYTEHIDLYDFAQNIRNYETSPTYVYQMVDYNFEDISITGENLYLADDSYTSILIPFDFTFGSQIYNAVSINSNGTIYFVDRLKDFYNLYIPELNDDGIQTFIAPFWDDLNPTSGGAVYYEVKGTAPERRLIVQYHQIPHFMSEGSVTFQAILFEETNEILFQYDDVIFEDTFYDNGASATVGVQLNIGNGTQYSYNSASLENELAILFKPETEIAMEVGKTDTDHNWKTIILSETYKDPVVIIGPPTYHGRQPGVVRVRNVEGNAFDVRFQEWNYLDGNHKVETIPYLVMERGRHEMQDGSIWEAGKFLIDKTRKWSQLDFNSSFPGIPTLILTGQTFNDSDPIVVRAKDVTEMGFKAALFEEEANFDGHEMEEVGYLAIYNQELSGTVNVNSQEIPYILQTQSVNHLFTPILSHQLKLEEEKSKDEEIAHIRENITVLSIGNNLFAQDISSKGGNTAALRRLDPEYEAPMEWGVVSGVDANWLQVPLFKEYTEPVVVVKPVSAYDKKPGVMRLRNISGNSFELRYDEWLYLDGDHEPEQAFYLVAEKGKHSLAGLQVEVGTISSSMLRVDGWEEIF